MKNRTLFIGDVHGCYEELLSLCEKMWLSPDDHLYFAGDIINKGPKSLEVVEFIRNRSNTWCVTGNHEYFSMKKEYIDYGQGSLTWINNQFEKTETIRSQLEQAGHKEWLLTLPVFIEKEDFILVHAGIHPDHGMNTPLEIATMIRQYEGRPWYEFYKGDKLIIYGHWAVDGLRIRKNTIGLDTGCCFGGHLTSYCLETKEIWQVRSNNVYKVIPSWVGKIQKIT